jgi:hypothetical protein
MNLKFAGIFVRQIGGRGSPYATAHGEVVLVIYNHEGIEASGQPHAPSPLPPVPAEIKAGLVPTVSMWTFWRQE